MQRCGHRTDHVMSTLVTFDHVISALRFWSAQIISNTFLKMLSKHIVTCLKHVLYVNNLNLRFKAHAYHTDSVFV